MKRVQQPQLPPLQTLLSPLEAKLTRHICLPHSHRIGASDFPRTRRVGPDPPRQHCAHPGGAPHSCGAGVKGEFKGCGARLGKHYRALCGTQRPSSPPAAIPHVFPGSPAPSFPPKAPSCSLPTSFSSTRSCWTGRRGRSWQPPESPTPLCPARVPTLYERGEPSCRCSLGCTNSGRPARSCLRAGGSGTSSEAVPGLYWQ